MKNVLCKPSRIFQMIVALSVLAPLASAQDCTQCSENYVRGQLECANSNSPYPDIEVPIEGCVPSLGVPGSADDPCRFSNTFLMPWCDRGCLNCLEGQKKNRIISKCSETYHFGRWNNRYPVPEGHTCIYQGTVAGASEELCSSTDVSATFSGTCSGTSGTLSNGDTFSVECDNPESGETEEGRMTALNGSVIQAYPSYCCYDPDTVSGSIDSENHPCKGLPDGWCDHRSTDCTDGESCSHVGSYAVFRRDLVDPARYPEHQRVGRIGWHDPNDHGRGDFEFRFPMGAPWEAGSTLADSTVTCRFEGTVQNSNAVHGGWAKYGDGDTGNRDREESGEFDPSYSTQMEAAGLDPTHPLYRNPYFYLYGFAGVNCRAVGDNLESSTFHLPYSYTSACGIDAPFPAEAVTGERTDPISLNVFGVNLGATCEQRPFAVECSFPSEVPDPPNSNSCKIEPYTGGQRYDRFDEEVRVAWDPNFRIWGNDSSSVRMKACCCPGDSSSCCSVGSTAVIVE